MQEPPNDCLESFLSGEELGVVRVVCFQLPFRTALVVIWAYTATCSGVCLATPYGHAGRTSGTPTVAIVEEELKKGTIEDFGRTHRYYHFHALGHRDVVITYKRLFGAVKSSAAAVAMQIKSTSSALRFGLLVGIFSGVPSKEADMVDTKPYIHQLGGHTTSLALRSSLHLEAGGGVTSAPAYRDIHSPWCCSTFSASKVLGH